MTSLSPQKPAKKPTAPYVLSGAFIVLLLIMAAFLYQRHTNNDTAEVAGSGNTPAPEASKTPSPTATGSPATTSVPTNSPSSFPGAVPQSGSAASLDQKLQSVDNSLNKVDSSSQNADNAPSDTDTAP